MSPLQGRLATMDLYDRCRREISQTDWDKGRNYLRSGVVRLFEPDHECLEAEVQGSERLPYTVWIDWSNVRKRVIGVDCDCPRFAEMEMCKHVAATILAMDSVGLASQISGRDALSIRTLDEIESEAGQGGLFVGQLNELIESLGFDPTDRSALRAQLSSPKKRSERPLWHAQMDRIAFSPDNEEGPTKPPAQLWYLLDIPKTLRKERVCLSLKQRAVRKDGQLGKMTTVSTGPALLRGNVTPEDQIVLGLLGGNEQETRYGQTFNPFSGYSPVSEFSLYPAMAEIVLRHLCQTNRFGWLPENGGKEAEVQRLTFDDGPAYKLELVVAKSDDQNHWVVEGRLSREELTISLAEPLVLLESGLAILSGRIVRFASEHAWPWIQALRKEPMVVPLKQGEQFVERLVGLPGVPRFKLPDELCPEEIIGRPRPLVAISRPDDGTKNELNCQLQFSYGEKTVASREGPSAWYDSLRRLVRRDRDQEIAAHDRLIAAGAKQISHPQATRRAPYRIDSQQLPSLVRELSNEDWQVEAEGRVIRSHGAITLSVKSAADWFDLDAECDFGGISASLPELLRSLRNGDKFILLDDGSQGILPEEWLQQWAPVAEFADQKNQRSDRLRFLPSQGAILDALLAANDQASVRVDRKFAEWRERLRSFEGIKPAKPARSFAGDLREYQKEGLGWLKFLNEFGFGGCLADDMGLGKTVQVLALLDERRRTWNSRSKVAKNASRTSLVVAPKSLVFNWIDEASRFAPKLKVVNYTGTERGSLLDDLSQTNLVVTTYGTARKDIAAFSKHRFDYVVLDEAQAIKNSSSQGAKACRLLKSQHRLALTGTPVENHLGDLWSIFEFLNPGMLGRQPRLLQTISASQNLGRQEMGNGDAEAADNTAFLSRVLRPFMLRRTKEQVLKELPSKTEQTLYCELGRQQRKMYDELLAHYRRSLFDRVSQQGMNRSKMHVLEALLRLRQAACHPGLVNPKKLTTESAKLEALMEQLQEVIAEGHKALVFSQFTSLLSIVRNQFDASGINYEYLDGKSTKRKSLVERFQTDPNCRVFLISLKAGGHGLNLTAADYVFILDPWWNPAVEAQAVDRVHRMGQKRHVFAYRLIARDTVEEKILELQRHKRDLADSIIAADNSIFRNLTAADLQLLLS